MRRLLHRAGSPLPSLPLAVALGLALAAPATGVRAEGRPPFPGDREPGTSGATLLFGPSYGLAAVEGGVRFGGEYSFSLNGPLLLSVEGNLLAGGGAATVQAIPGVRYRLEVPGYPLPVHLKAGLATDIHTGPDGGRVAVMVRLGGGTRYFVSPSVGVGPDLDLLLGMDGGGGGLASSVSVAVAMEYLLP